MKIINTMKTGQLIKKIAEENGYTAHSLANKLYVTQFTVFKWYSGVNVPKVDNLITMAELFNKKLDDLIVCDFI